MSDTDSIFIDKVREAFTFIEKRNKLSNQYNTVIRDLNAGYIDLERLNEYDPFLWACQNFAELYGSILRYKYSKVLKKEEKEKIEQAFISWEEDGGLTLPQLKIAYQLTIKIMSLNNFDDVIFKGKQKLKGIKHLRDLYGLDNES